eukprot:266157-Chlamydomonas_euryale.AAC.1
MPAADAGARACSRRNIERGRVAQAESAGRRLTAVRKGRVWNTANLRRGHASEARGNAGDDLGGRPRSRQHFPD